MGKYTVTWAYRDGNPYSQEFDAFGDALECSAAKRARGIVTHITGESCEGYAEDWDDGLTEEERDQP